MSTSTKRKRERAAAAAAAVQPQDEPAGESTMSSGGTPKFGLMLGANDKATRDKAVQALTRYLKRAPEISELELAKIWKALFYCMWHSDKPATQADLAERLAGLVHAVVPGRRLLFVRAFWETMMREWFGIDRLRLNKYYMLLRRVLEHTLQELRARGWEAEDLAWHAELLRTGPLSKRAPLGLRYFLVDGVLAALRGELGGCEAGDGGPLLPLLEPFFAVLGAASDDKEVCLASRLPRLRAFPRRRPHAPSTLLGSGAACRITSLSRCSAATTTRARRCP
jgi:ribosomal RNA-processing protein 1